MTPFFTSRPREAAERPQEPLEHYISPDPRDSPGWDNPTSGKVSWPSQPYKPHTSYSWRPPYPLYIWLYLKRRVKALQGKLLRVTSQRVRSYKRYLRGLWWTVIWSKW